MAVPFRIRRAEWVAGAFVVVVVLAVLATLLWLARGHESLQGRARYRVLLDQGHGVAPGGPVEMLGIAIGSVESVEITDDNRVEVTLEVGSTYADKIREDSEARLQARLGLQGVLGGIGFAISPGSAEASLIEPGGVIEAIPPKNAADLIAGVSGDPIVDDAEALVHNLRILTDDIANPESDQRKLLADIAVIVARLRAGQGTAGKLLADDELYDRLLATLDELEATLGRTNRLLARTGKMVGQGEAVFESSEDMLASGQKAFGSADDLFTNAEPVVKKTERTMDNLDAAVKSFQKVNRDLADVTADLHDLVAEMRKVTDAAGRMWILRRRMRKSDGD